MDMRQFVKALSAEERRLLKDALYSEEKSRMEKEFDFTSDEMRDWVVGDKKKAAGKYCERTGKGLITAMQSFTTWDRICRESV